MRTSSVRVLSTLTLVLGIALTYTVLPSDNRVAIFTTAAIGMGVQTPGRSDKCGRDIGLSLRGLAPHQIDKASAARRLSKPASVGFSRRV
jgi:hypothetical protein